jgi:hypothetical protein
LNAFYHTGRPTIHIDPVAKDATRHYRRVLRWGRLWVKKVADPLASWKLPPTDVGGLVAHDFDELLAAVDRALNAPECCAELASAFNRRHVTSADGHTSARIEQYLASWVGA